MVDELAKRMRKAGYRAMWRPLASRKTGKAYGPKKQAQKRAKKYRKIKPKESFRVRPNYPKTEWTVEIRDWF